MQRFLNALCGGKLAASWRIWAIAVAKERDGHAVLTKAMLRVNKAAVAWGLRQWLDVMAWDAEQGYQALQQALRASQMQIKELKETKSARSMQRYLNAICLSRLSLAWQQWTAWKLELDRLGQLLNVISIILQQMCAFVGEVHAGDVVERDANYVHLAFYLKSNLGNAPRQHSRTRLTKNR